MPQPPSMSGASSRATSAAAFPSSTMPHRRPCPGFDAIAGTSRLRPSRPIPKVLASGRQKSRLKRALSAAASSARRAAHSPSPRSASSSPSQRLAA